MKILITESQLQGIRLELNEGIDLDEQLRSFVKSIPVKDAKPVTKPSPISKIRYGTNVMRAVGPKNYQNFRKENPVLANTLEDLTLWFIPVVGPYLVGAKNVCQSYELYKDGKHSAAVISFLTSPLSLSRTASLMKLSGQFNPNVINMLRDIHSTGVTTLVSRGNEAFLNWAYPKYKDDFIGFMNVLNNKSQMSQILKK